MPILTGATGNVATEDILYALQGFPYSASGDPEALADVGFRISGKLWRDNSSRVGNGANQRSNCDLCIYIL